ncbi:50S ribosomal protein L29 [Flagellatimonas centrodinii]|uniref:50S ribosomal protein L29 n=1 Tax=Flagellatimonas centrodinii TaxID=2806210 RepID=UPI001FF056A8|nr:50S ribosomal protein L29 [Flagellatimonas centrodinii]ULQ47332.1 50S ribosomal protein L29 [Flagellatimonas centrodinii]
MKAAEYVKDLRGKSSQELTDELIALRKEQFNLRMQSATGQMNKSHLVGEVRKKIARVKTVMQSQVKAS